MRDNGSSFQNKIIPKKSRTVSRKETSPTELRVRPGTRHPHGATLSYFAVPACLIKTLFPLQKASVIIHSAFPPFVSHCFPGLTEHCPLKLNGCCLILMETPWHKQVKPSEKAEGCFSCLFLCLFFFPCMC